MLLLLLLYLGIASNTSASDFENARILGSPRLSCSKKSISLFFETNIPFQGRISIMKKMYIPECNQDYSANIMRNATFKMDIGRCTDTNYMTNGSRVLTVHVEIGFHPLVITSSDRVYSVQCIDNSYAIVRNIRENASINCSHVVRTAAKWEGLTVFHVGDAVVHEWSCALDQQDNGNAQLFLTSCNAISQAGQIIHLVDENGCVVDSELMGDLVYNNYTPKIYARAKIFKLMNGERYRVECNIQMCRREGTCKNRPFPPKCAFTKDEIISRYETKLKNIDDALMTGAANPGFEKQVKVTSEWITVHSNQYTNVDQLHERYFLNTVMDPDVAEEAVTMSSNHFLMGISYRDPNRKSSSSEGIADRSVVTSPIKTSFRPQLSPTISSSEEDMIETISDGLIGSVTSMPVEKVNKFINTIDAPVKIATAQVPMTTVGISSSTRLTGPRPPPATVPIVFTPKTTMPTSTTKKRPTTTTTSTSTTTTTTTTKPITTTTMMNTPFLTSAFDNIPLIDIRPAKTKEEKNNNKKKDSVPLISPVTIVTSVKIPKSPIKGNVATMRFYTDKQLTTQAIPSVTTVEYPFTTEMPFKKDSEIFMNHATPAENKSSVTKAKDTIKSKIKDKFANPRDWRLDDRTINDTDTFSDKQVSCGNGTLSPSSKRCVWTGLDHLLVVWSFGSALVWMVMLGVCFYRNSHRKPNWVAYREREMKRANRARILPQEHPWLHADAFEEPKLKKKHEIDMNKF